MHRWAWSVLWWITVPLSCTTLTAQEPLAIGRKKVAGKVLRLDQSPWPGAAVTLVGTAHPQFWQLGEPDTVHTTTDDRGRFYAELLPWRTYSAWAHGEHQDGGYRLTDIANSVIAGTEVVLRERTLRQCATEIRLVDDGNGERPLGALSFQFLCLAPEHAYRVPVTFGADGVAKVPPLAGWRAQFEAVTDHGVRVWRTVLPLTEPLRDKIVRSGDTGDHEFPRDRIHTATLHLPKPWPVQLSVFVNGTGPAAGAEILLGAPSSGGYLRDALDCRPIARTAGNGKATIPMYVRRDDSDRLLPPAPDLIVRAPGCLEVVAPMLRSNAFTGPFGIATGIGLQPGGTLLRGRLWLGPGRPAANVDLLFCWKPYDGRRRSDDERTLPFRTDREGRFEIPCTSTTQPWRLSALLPVREAQEREEHALVGSLGDVAPELGDIYANELVPLRIAVRDGNGAPMDRAVLHVGEPGGPDAPWTWVTDKLGHCTVRVPPRTPLAVFAATPQGFACIGPMRRAAFRFHCRRSTHAWNLPAGGRQQMVPSGRRSAKPWWSRSAARTRRRSPWSCSAASERTPPRDTRRVASHRSPLEFPFMEFPFMLRSPLLCVLSLPLFAQGWVDRTPTNPAATPSARAFPAMCWDAAHNYVLMYGGLHQVQIIRTDTWSWDGTTWTRRITPTTPNAYDQTPMPNAMTFDPPSGSVILVSHGHTYFWTGTDWFNTQATLFDPIGTPSHVAMGHDPQRNQTVLFIGARSANTTTVYDAGETWVWAGTAWIQRTPPVQPYPCRFPSIAFDPVVGRLVLTTTGNGQSGCFEWNGTNWQQRFPVPMPTAPGVTATDTGNQRIVMLDGVLQNSPGHTWTLHNGTVTQIASAAEPARRIGAAMAFDPVRGRAVLFGGTSFYTVPGLPSMFAMGDTWEFTLGASASYSTFGAGCAGSRGVVSLGAQGSSTPRIGQTLELHIGNLPLTGPAFLFLGISNTNYGPTTLPFSLAGLGAPNCSILASGDELSVLTNVLGTAVWQRTMPAFPGLVFYNQAFALDPSANTLGLTASNGGRGTVGF